MAGYVNCIWVVVPIGRAPGSYCPRIKIWGSCTAPEAPPMVEWGAVLILCVCECGFIMSMLPWLVSPAGKWVKFWSCACSCWIYLWHSRITYAWSAFE